MRRTTPEEREMILRLAGEGLDSGEIARRVGIPAKNVSSIIWYHKNRKRERKPRAERPPERERGETKALTVTELIDSGKSANYIAFHRGARMEHVRRAVVSRKTKLKPDEVPVTWAGAFRTLAEFARKAGADEVYDFACVLADAKDMKL